PHPDHLRDPERLREWTTDVPDTLWVMTTVTYERGLVGFGIDIGGSGIKGAPADIKSGELLTKRFRVPTPTASTPEAVAECLAEVLQHFDVPTETAVGITFPGIIQHGVVLSSANLDKSWIGT